MQEKRAKVPAMGLIFAKEVLRALQQSEIEGKGVFIGELSKDSQRIVRINGRTQ